MVIKKLSDVPFTDLQGYDHIKKQIVIGPDDGSQEIVLRYFSIEPGGASPHHTHDYPHLVKIEAGNGMVTDATGNEHHLQTGNYVYINNNQAHRFRNTGSESFDFICIVPQKAEG
jgi:quercetin dioxygenase-like cupin family protein